MNGLDRLGLQRSGPEQENRVPRKKETGLTIRSGGHHDRMFGGNPHPGSPGGQLQVLFGDHPDNRPDFRFPESAGSHTPDRVAHPQPFNGHRTLQRPNRSALFQAAAPAPGPGKGRAEQKEQQPRQSDQPFHRCLSR